MKDVLGITPRDVKETVLEEARVLVERGLVKKPKRVRGQGASAAAADGDAKADIEGTSKEEEEKTKENGDVNDESAVKSDTTTEEGQGDNKDERKEDEPVAQEKNEDTPAEGTQAKPDN